MAVFAVGCGGRLFGEEGLEYSGFGRGFEDEGGGAAEARALSLASRSRFSRASRSAASFSRCRIRSFSSSSRFFRNSSAFRRSSSRFRVSSLALSQLPFSHAPLAPAVLDALAPVPAGLELVPAEAPYVRCQEYEGLGGACGSG